MRSRRTWWLVFGACALAVVAGLLWISVEMLRLERSEFEAREDAAQQEAVRLALWRMDSWFAPRLGREAARQYFDYRPFYPQQRAYTKLLNQIEPGEVLTPSPLLSFESEYVRLHFQLWPDGRFTSPQAPTGNARDLAEDGYLSGEQIDANLQTLNAMCEIVKPGALVECVAAAPAGAPGLAPDAAAAPHAPIDPPRTAPSQIDAQAQSQSQRTQVEWTKRQEAYVQNTLDPEAMKQVFDGGERQDDVGIDVGPLVPFWAGPGPGPGSGPGPEGRAAAGVIGELIANQPPRELMFVRGVRAQDQQYVQGFLCDWPKLRSALMAEITDLLPGARLVPVPNVALVGVAGSGDAGKMLATVPARLEVPAGKPAMIGWRSPARATLLVTWLAVLAGLAAVAVTLHASIAFGEKRSRFASAVTHELRTPLTTFRMYSEMLADGMVTDPETRKVYLQTLKSESDRLAGLVENVLAYARLERGSARIEPKATTLGGLLESVEPGLAQRAAEAGMTLAVRIEGEPESPLIIDVEAVRQILHNLVDNACKYAADAATRVIDLTAGVEGGKLVVAVRDHGPGVGDEHVRAIFAPFERGAREPGDTTPGVGLGLALARGLARRLGGDLGVEPAVASGACFRLSVPTGTGEQGC